MVISEMGGLDTNQRPKKKRIYLHIGTHRTGSTSLQKILADNKHTLHQFDYDLYQGLIESNNHIELYLAAMRPERESLAKIKYSVTVDEAYVEEIKSQFRNFVSASPYSSIIVTTEGLSLLRFGDELERLRDILDVPKHEITVVLVLRNKKDFLESYKNQILKSPGRRLSKDPQSPLYVEADSWIADFDTLQILYRGHFGAKSLRIVDYDAEMKRENNVLPAVLSAFGLNSVDFVALSDYQMNASRHVIARYLSVITQKIKRYFGG